jgi:hypothetical protein
MVGAPLRHRREDVVLVVRHDLLEGVGELEVLPADDQRQLEALARELVQALAQLVALAAAGGVALDRLVIRLGRARNRVGAHGRRL